MQAPPIRFDDGAAYEDFMGGWSRLVGDVFLDWLAPAPGLGWIDVGCGNGAFSQRLVERCAPSRLVGIDPSEGQLAFARSRLTEAQARFEQGDAMALPHPDASFDAAVMALVIFFVPEPARGVAEMARVVRPGGSVSAYGWDFGSGGFPYAAIHAELAAIGIPPALPPRPEAGSTVVMDSLWREAGLTAVETRRIDVARRFDDFEGFWRIAQGGPAVAPSLASVPADARAGLKEKVRERLGAPTRGAFTCRARASAVRGVVPG